MIVPLPPDPRVFEASPIPSGESERRRLAQSLRPTDFVTTGLYVAPDATLTVDVSGSRDLPTLLVGTYSYDPQDPGSFPLKAGRNEIRDPRGGLLWIRYPAPKGSRATLVFGNAARPAPLFRRGSDARAWPAALAASDIPSAILLASRAVVVVRREAALKYADRDPARLLDVLDRVHAIEDDALGLPVPERPRTPTLMAEHPKDSPYMYATWYRTAYTPGSVRFILDPDALTKDGWGPWHELGHMRQSDAWTWRGMGEVTVNVYSRAVERAFGNGSRFDRDGLAGRVDAYLARPEAERDYDAVKDPFVKLGMLERLRVAFGDRLFRTLSRTARARKDAPGDSPARRDWFAVESSRIARRDLRPFFRAWGLRLSPTAEARIAAMGLTPY